jgi:putative acetyltransferase
MFEAYQNQKQAYFVAELGGNIVGGSGIKGLKGSDACICELQKLYLLPAARGLGIGRALTEKCIEFAIREGYKKCYLETFPNMQSAINLYVKLGFKELDSPLGNTGHGGCDVWMVKNI